MHMELNIIQILKGIYRHFLYKFFFFFFPQLRHLCRIIYFSHRYKEKLSNYKITEAWEKMKLNGSIAIVVLPFILPRAVLSIWVKCFHGKGLAFAHN